MKKESTVINSPTPTTTRRHAQKVARPAFVAGTSFDLVAVERKVFMDPVVRSVPHLQNDPRRIGRRFIGEPTVRPADELLRNEDRIQAVGKSHDTPLEISELPPSRKIQIEGNTRTRSSLTCGNPRVEANPKL